MASWYASIVTKTSSQISSLRSTLLSGEADGDTEDDTHVCRVLRNYYTDKGRPRPAWLPADPKAAQQAPQALYTQPQLGSRYGGLNNPGGGGGGGLPASSSLASLWDNGPSQQPPAQPQSLRAGRPPLGGGTLQPNGTGREDVAARPLPSQRTGSYQSVNSQAGSGGGGGGGATAQDRLKQRLWGAARSASPAAQNQNPYGAPPPQAAGGGGQYDGGRAAAGGGGGDPYGRGPPGGQRQGLPSGPRGYR
ncbi:hypothetical protein V2A60_000757 [Cordyceps javanica]|uniref:Sec1-binding region of mso1 domain-containing protein n=1 Tax=Cordyceps javanica TaxID=43265 RepID=A0A545V1J0_9HYPO|nr:sec1-binding region of mso1 domain-containing protein [Cordyceps javanica]TQW07228.1 sec1-binding region of mso1 domain-containing protein [Cordyceps javanica]